MKNVYGISNWNRFENTLKIILLVKINEAVMPARGLNNFLPIRINNKMLRRLKINGIIFSVTEFIPNIIDAKYPIQIKSGGCEPE